MQNKAAPCTDENGDIRCEMAAWRIYERMESRIMIKIFKDHGFECLLPSGEAPQNINRKKEIG